MLYKFFFITNLILLGVVFSLKSYYESSVFWFYELPWFTFFNLFIDVAIKSTVNADAVLTFWLMSTFIWSGYTAYSRNFFINNPEAIKKQISQKPLDIDELDQKYSNLPEENKDEKPQSNSIPEAAGANFAAALSKAVTSKTNNNDLSHSDGFFDQANQALSSMPPEAAEQLKKVQTVLSHLETNDVENKSENNKK